MEDFIVFHLVMLVLHQLAGVVPVEDFDFEDRACVYNLEEYRIFVFHVKVLDNIPFPVEKFCKLMRQYSQLTPSINPQLYSMETYPLPHDYCSYYISISI